MIYLLEMSDSRLVINMSKVTQYQFGFIILGRTTTDTIIIAHHLCDDLTDERRL